MLVINHWIISNTNNSHGLHKVKMDIVDVGMDF